MASLTQTVSRPFNRHDYNGIARVSTKSERADVKADFDTWISGTYIPAVQNANPISSVTNSNGAVVTSTAHGFSNGNVVIILGVDGMSQINEGAYTVANVTANTFVLSGVDTTTYSSYRGSGVVFLRPTGFAYTGLAYT